MDLLSCILLVFLSFHGAKSTFSPSGSVSIDCGGQQSFTCTVAANGPAAWIITGLQGIDQPAASNGILTSSANARVTTTDTSPTSLTSTITITGFTTADNTGIVRCVDQAATVEGSATIVVGPPQCGQVGMTVSSNDSCPCFTFTPQGNVLPLTVVMLYYPQGEPSSARTLNCDYPVDPRMCKLNVSGGTYAVRATPQNNCGSPSNTCSSVTVIVPANCTTQEELTPPADLSGLYSLLVLPLLLLIIITYSISVAGVWHLYYKDYNYCQVYWCCCFCKPREGDGKIRTSSTEPMKTSPLPPPAPVAAAPLGEYADPKDVRKRKEENKIQYADLEFTKQSGGGQGSIHQKEEPVTYTAIQHA